MAVLNAQTSEIRSVHSILKCIGSTKLAELQIREAGLQFRVQMGHELMSRAYIPRDFFDEYTFNSVNEVECMEISISSLIETINIYGTASTGLGDSRDKEQKDQQEDNPGNTHLRLSYEGYGYPLAMDIIAPPTYLPDDSTWSPKTTVELRTSDCTSQEDLPFDDEDVYIRIIMQSQWLSDALNALEAQTDIVTLSSPADESPNAAALRLSAISDTGALEFDFPMSEREATTENGPIEHYQRTVQGVVSEKYKAVHILHAQKAIAASHKTSMRINAMGMLSMQMMMMDARGKQNYIDFRCRPIESEYMF